MTATKMRRGEMAPGQSFRTQEVEAPFTPLERAILKAGCPILDDEDVAAYKAAKLKARMAEIRQREPFWQVFAAIYCLVAAGSLWGGFCFVPHSGWGFLFLLFAVVSICSLVGVLLPREPAGPAPAWCTEMLESIWNPPYLNLHGVPEPVRDSARVIAGSCPRAQFSLDWFYQDPFLAVEYEGQKFYIAYWDEPGFAGAS